MAAWVLEASGDRKAGTQHPSVGWHLLTQAHITAQTAEITSQNSPTCISGWTLHSAEDDRLKYCLAPRQEYFLSETISILLCLLSELTLLHKPEGTSCRGRCFPVSTELFANFHCFSSPWKIVLDLSVHKAFWVNKGCFKTFYCKLLLSTGDHTVTLNPSVLLLWSDRYINSILDYVLWTKFSFNYDRQENF